MAQRKATSQEKLLEAAAMVFREKGYAAATLDDIAGAAGISKPTVYRYAKNKQWLLDHIVKTTRLEMESKRASLAAEGTTPLERLRLHILANVEIAMEYAHFYEVTQVHANLTSARAAREFKEWAIEITGHARQLLADAVADGVLDLPGDLTIYANLLQSMLASMHRWVRPDGRFSAAEIADHVLELLSSVDRAGLVDTPVRSKAP